MNATMSRNLIRFVAAPVAAAGILGGPLWASPHLPTQAPSRPHQRSARMRVMRRNARRPSNVQINTEPGNAALDAAQQQYPFFGYGYEGLCCFITAAPLTVTWNMHAEGKIFDEFFRPPQSS